MTLRLHPDQIVAESSSPLLAVAPGWERIRLGDVAEVINGAAFSSSRFNNEGRGEPLVRIRDVGGDRAQVHYDGPYEERHVLKHADLLVGMDGDFRVAPWGGSRAVLNQRVCRLAVMDERLYSERFLLHVLQPYLDAVHAVTSSVTVKHLSSRTIQDLPLPLPPRVEQERIVATIEEHLSRLDAAQAATASGQRRLAGFYDSVLQAVFDPAWPREMLDSLNNPERPICYGILKPKTPEPGSVPYVEVRSIAKGQIKVAELHRTTVALHQEFRRSELRAGDVTLAIRGSFDRAAVVPEELVGANVSRDVARIAPIPQVLPEFLAAFLVSPEARRFFRAHARGVAVQGINIGDLRRLPVPNPSVEIQRAAVRRVDAARSAIDHIEGEVRVGGVRSRQLRRSILAAAFSGQLVPQDPDAEPASVLLERIRTERNAATPTKRIRKARSS